MQGSFHQNSLFWSQLFTSSKFSLVQLPLPLLFQVSGVLRAEASIAASMKTETEPTVHPLSPRFASLEKSLSEYNGHSNESPRYDGESNASPRILTKAGNYVFNQAEGRNELEIPIFNLSPLSTLPFLRELAGNRNMSLSLEKTLDSESLSITTKPLWDELVEAGYGHDFQYETTDGADHSSAGIVERKSDMLNKEDNNDSGSIKSPANRRKQLGASNSRQQRAPTKDAGGTANNIKNVVLGESLNSVVLKSQRSDHEREISGTKVKDLNNLTLPDTAVIEPKQTPVSSNMERKLLSTLPKKLREEAVLRTFAANLKQASSTSRSAAPKKLSLEGRQSADSGRESVLEDEAYPRLYRFDSSSSVSSVGSTRSAVRGGANSGIKPWSVVMMAETIKKRRQEAASKGKRAKMELVSLDFRVYLNLISFCWPSLMRT